MNEILARKYHLRPVDIDIHKRCKLSALLGYLQDMSTEHAIILGIGGEQMAREHNAAWMMVRVHLTLSRPIGYEDVLDIITWHRGVGKTAAVFRDFDIFVGGECIGEAVISWVLADITQRKILKPATIPSLAHSPRPTVVKDIIPAKIKAPPEMELALIRPDYYSDTDINGHVNNTKYADMACDALHYERYGDQYISQVEMNYVQEGFPGETLTLYCGKAEDVRHVRGMDEVGKLRFEVRMEFGGV